MIIPKGAGSQGRRCRANLGLDDSIPLGWRERRVNVGANCSHHCKHFRAKSFEDFGPFTPPPRLNATHSRASRPDGARDSKHNAAAVWTRAIARSHFNYCRLSSSAPSLHTTESRAGVLSPASYTKICSIAAPLPFAPFTTPQIRLRPDARRRPRHSSASVGNPPNNRKAKL
jgi:hypothetical protein